MKYTYFTKYGRQCELKEPWRGVVDRCNRIDRWELINIKHYRL